MDPYAELRKQLFVKEAVKFLSIRPLDLFMSSSLHFFQVIFFAEIFVIPCSLSFAVIILYYAHFNFHTNWFSVIFYQLLQIHTMYDEDYEYEYNSL